MYESFYKLRAKPFSLLPDPAYLYLGKEHDLGFSILRYGLTNEAGFTVLTGEVGAGKTTLIRYLLNSLGDEVVVGLISNTNMQLASIMEWVADSFSIDVENMSGIGLYNALVDCFLQHYSQGKRVLLIVDEAQNLDEKSLESLRLISNINSDQHQLVQIILVGQPELRDMLQRPSLRQFAQRVSIDYHLARLSVVQTSNYVKHRLKVAGAVRMLFDPGAVGQIAYHSQGIPRLINNIADLGLVYGFAKKQPIVDEAIIKEVVQDRNRQGILPTHKLAAATC
ncbi:MAG: AAA family ATPase [Pseudomonadales bacterium]|nr:AAA family ATPase [Pseudomonadales bacterium]